MSYLGKISAIVSANTSDFQSKLSASAKEVRSFASSMQRSLNTASTQASSSLRGIYTEAQKLERALKAVQSGKLSFKGFDAKNLQAAANQMRAVYSAAAEVNKPLSQAARTLEKLPADVQGGFVEAMKRAQAQTERLASEIDKIGAGTLLSNDALEKKFEAIRGRVQATSAAVARLKEATAAVSGLATGNELGFRRPEFASEIARARRLQGEAAGGDFSSIIERQRASAEAAAAALSRLEEAQLSIGGDVRGATAEYEKQLAALQGIGTELEQAVAATRAATEAELERTAAIKRSTEAASRFLQVNQRESTLLSNEGLSTDVRARLRAIEELRRAEEAAEARRADAARRAMAASELLVVNQRESTLQSNEGAATDVRNRLQAMQAVERAAQEEAAYRGKAADQAEREAKATEVLVERLNRAANVERDRRNGSLARRNSAAFDSATAGLLSTAPQPRSAVFGQESRTIQTELQRTAQLYREFVALSPNVQAALEGDRRALDNVATGARDGAASLGVLVSANDRMADAIRRANDESARQAAATAASESAARRWIATNDRLIAQERQLAEERQRTAAATQRSQASQLRSASAAILGPRRSSEPEIAQVYSGLTQQAVQFRAAVESAFGLPQYDELRQQLVRAGSEIQSIEQEIARLNSLDPQRDIIEYADAWSRVESRVRQVNDMMQGGSRLANQAIAAARQRADEEQRAANAMRGNAAGAFGPTPPPGSRSANGITRVPPAVGPSSPFFPGNRGGNPSGEFGPAIPPGFDPRRAALLSANIGASTNIAEARRQQAVAQRQRLANEFAGGLTGRGAGGINFDIERRSLQGYTEQLRILETTLARASAEARGPAVAAFARLRDYIATAFDEGRIDAAATRAEIQRLTQEAVRATSAATGMRAGALGRRVSRAGDVGRMGLGNASLALNQAAFAIDDFMSSTGGIEFKIRAISNNITQLGFVLGGTFGLFASLGVIVATNVGLFIAKTTGLLEDTKRQEELAKAATDALTDSFENQKKTVEGLAEAYREFSKEVRNSVLSSGDKERASREDTVAGLREQQAARRREEMAIRLPRIMALRARRSDLESQAAKEENQGRQFQLRRQIGQTVRQEDEIVRRTEAAAADRVRANDVRVTPAGAFIRDQTDQRLADLLANPAGNQRAIEIMSREAAEITVGARQIQDAARVAAVDLALQLRETFEQLQERASGVADFLPKSTNEAITAASREIADFARGRAVTEDAARARFGEISNQMQAIGPQIAGAEALKRQQEFIAKTQPDVLREAEAAMARGRELSMTPGQRAAEEAAKGLEDIRRNFGNLAADGNGLIDRGGMGEAMSRFATEQARSAAPAIFSMADEVANAVLQGPSRQALQVSDISTTQGRQELDRLLRGDDSAKNANVVELEKQNQKLTELVTTMKDVAAKMGVVLDL